MSLFAPVDDEMVGVGQCGGIYDVSILFDAPELEFAISIPIEGIQVEAVLIVIAKECRTADEVVVEEL